MFSLLVHSAAATDVAPSGATTTTVYGGGAGAVSPFSGSGSTTVAGVTAGLREQLRQREAAHVKDLEALATVTRTALETEQTLQSERAWVLSLDEMRLSDLKTIQLLEARLRQWALWLPDDVDARGISGAGEPGHTHSVA